MFIAVFLMMKFQDILNQIDDMDYFKAIYLLMAGYVGFALLYQIFAFVLYAIRFQRAKVGLVTYNRNLKKLIVFGEARPKKRKKTQAIRVNNSIGGEEIEFENPKGRRNN
jgi:hypothetical protein